MKMKRVFAIFLLVASVTASEVCYPPYGCYSDDAPFDEVLVQLPWSPKELKTKFMLFNRTHRDHPSGTMDPEDLTSPQKISFSPNKKTVFFTHGFIEGYKRWWIELMIGELLKNEDMNVVFVEWKIGSAFPYHQAVGNTRIVGAQVARMIEVIRNSTGLDWSRLHLIGFSLGAHVMGYAGKILREKGLLVPRISAIDPASPYYENKHVDRRIDPTDAAFVDAIHTDTKTLIVNGFGTVQLMGHVDFYPNGGYTQPGCWNFDRSVLEYLACSHYRSLRFYIESINSPCPFYGYPCKASYDDFRESKKCTECPPEGCPRMGYHATQPSKNSLLGYKHYLKTHGDRSYCAYHYTLTVDTGAGFLKDLNGEVSVTLFGETGTEKVDIEKKYYDSGEIKKVLITTKKDLGRLQRVKVEHDRILDIWYLKSVKIHPLWKNETYTADFNRWLNTPNNIVKLRLGNPSSKKVVVV